MLHGALMTKETLGKHVYNNWHKHDEVSSSELASCMLPDIEKILWQAVDRGRKRFAPKDFFIELAFKVERSVKKTVHNYAIERLSAPTPHYDCSAFKYHYSSDELEFLWVVPDFEACRYVMNNLLNIPEEQKELRDMVVDFYDGTLLKMAKKFNNEKIDSPLLEK